MSEYIEITPSGLHLFKWDSDKEDYIEKEIHSSTILVHLRKECRIPDGTTLGDVFKAVERFPPLKDFIAQYSWCRELEAFHEQAKLPSTANKDVKLDFLEVYSYAEMNEFSGFKDFEFDVGFHGIGYESDGVRTQYSVSYSPMYELAHLQLKLNNEIIIHQPYQAGKGIPPKEIFRGTKCFSLLEVLDAIYFDISFMGGPEDNVAFVRELDKEVEEIRASISSQGD